MSPDVMFQLHQRPSIVVTRSDVSVYTIKREYETQTDGATRKFADLAPRPIEGVGPRTHQGMPVTLKSAVKEEHQPEWYKLMYDSLHRAKPGRYNYQGGGYASEPEAGYASDTGRRAAFGGRDQPDADAPRPAGGPGVMYY
ncbi:uncharacterized protein LOC119090666 isoform X2 [Pollicipes pollicipes]|uniref:uncharacterized protein LOC119090666 isoform X2 n=1 Tax=Pollicipes pollicipes TaxID=41117 RepID=UPI001885A112|nr:uncharacterized protein LOC119090666 isoform X2 [Pollicipes pollicipes]